MRKFITTTALIVLVAGPAAIAQTGNTGTQTGNTGTSGAANQPRSIPEAPIGHRQPRADQVPPENNLSDPNAAMNKEDAALDRKIKSICRGC
jgi:hypothetical protein